MGQIKKWSYDEAKEESKKYKNKQDFKKSQAYNQSVRNGWLNDFFENSIIRWTKEMAHQEALKYETKIEFINGNIRILLIKNQFFHKHSKVNRIRFLF